MKTEIRPIDAVKPYPGNLRANNVATLVIAWSIRKIGFYNPILVDGKDEVISGHIQLAAVRNLGITEVPVIVCDSQAPIFSAQQ